MIDWPEPGLDSRLVGLGIALGLGLLIGLEREWAEDKPIGLRSFGLIGLFGGLAAAFMDQAGPWMIVAGLISLSLLLAATSASVPGATGITTLVAGLTVFMVGAAAVAGYWLHATVIAGAVTLILHWKQPMHQAIGRLGRSDLEIIARFVLITLVILPVLPNRTFGPYDVFNPFSTWLLVVLIVGMNLAGYVVFQVAGTRGGSWLAGLVGGMVSSTATTLGYASLSRRAQNLGPLATLVILLASAVVYVRILLEVSVVSPRLLPAITWPCAVFAGLLLVCSAAVYLAGHRGTESELPGQQNPAKINTALIFGGVYVVVLFAVAAVRDLVGDDAVYGAAFLSGLMNIDALTLTMSRLHVDSGLSANVAWRAIFLGSLANLVFKLVAVSFLGSPSLRKWMLAAGLPALLAGTGILVFWPR